MQFHTSFFEYNVYFVISGCFLNFLFIVFSNFIIIYFLSDFYSFLSCLEIINLCI